MCLSLQLKVLIYEHYVIFVENPRTENINIRESHQYHKQVDKEKKERTQDLTRFDNLSTSLGQKGIEFSLKPNNYRIHYQG